MAPNENSKLSAADALVLGAIQIMIGFFHVLMWFFLLVLYLGQKAGTFGAYEPITYKAGCALWGTFFIISGVLIIRGTKQPTPCVVSCTLLVNILCIIASIAAFILTIIELSHFRSVSYRNYGQAKVGRVVSRVLLLSYPLEFCIAFVYSVFICLDRGESEEESLSNIEEAESSL